MKIILSILFISTIVSLVHGQPAAAAKKLRINIVGSSSIKCMESLSRTFSIPIGFVNGEKNLNESCDIQITSGTLSDALDIFVKQNGEYRWSIEGDVVHVLPKDTETSDILTNLLKLEVNTFSFKTFRHHSELRAKIYEIPVFKEFCSANSIIPFRAEISMFFGASISTINIEMSNTKLMAILDQIAAKSKYKTWFLSMEGDKDKFVNLNFL